MPLFSHEETAEDESSLCLVCDLYNVGDVGERDVDTILGQMTAQSCSSLRTRLLMPQDRMGSEQGCWLPSRTVTRTNHDKT